MELRSLPDTYTHDQQWESNPRPFNLESNVISTPLHAHDGVCIYHREDILLLRGIFVHLWLFVL